MTTKTKSRQLNKSLIMYVGWWWPEGGIWPRSNSYWELSGWSQSGRESGVLKSTDTRRARSQWIGSLGFGVTWFFILLHSQFVAFLLNALPHVADHVSCFTHSSFKITSNYSILVINILALSKVIFLFTFIGQNPIKPFMPTADIITTDQISYQMFCTDHHLLQTDPTVPWQYKKWLQLQMQKLLNPTGEASFKVKPLRNHIESCNRHSFSANSLCQALYKDTLRKYIC